MAHVNSFPANAVTGASTDPRTGPARLVRNQICKIQNRIGGLSNRQGILPSISIACRSQRTTIVPAATSDRREDSVAIRESGETSLMSPCGIYWSNSTGSHLPKARRLARPISSAWAKAGDRALRSACECLCGTWRQNQIWWTHKGSNLGPLPCEGNALPLSYASGIFGATGGLKAAPGRKDASSEPAIYEVQAYSVKRTVGPKSVFDEACPRT